MKIKIYRAIGLQKLLLQVVVKGKTQNVVLSGGSYFPKLAGMIRTSDKDLQTALEKHPSFNKTFYLEDTEWIREEKPAEVAGKDKPLEFNNFNELRDYLIKEHGKAPITVSTMAKATREMEKLGLKYTMK